MDIVYFLSERRLLRPMLVISSVDQQDMVVKFPGFEDSLQFPPPNLFTVHWVNGPVATQTNCRHREKRSQPRSRYCELFGLEGRKQQTCDFLSAGRQTKSHQPSPRLFSTEAMLGGGHIHNQTLKLCSDIPSAIIVDFYHFPLSVTLL